MAVLLRVAIIQIAYKPLRMSKMSAAKDRERERERKMQRGRMT